MKISVFGLGYVGCVTAACLATDGHEVIGVDVNPLKVELISLGKSPISEPGLDELIRNTVERGQLLATTDPEFAVQQSEISLVCVGTPSDHKGCANLEFVDRVCSEIGKSMLRKTTYHVVVIRSTVPPGTVIERIIPKLEENSKKRVGIDFGLCMNPEFLREGTAIKDFYHPGYTVIGQYDTQSGDAIINLYKKVNASLTRTTIPIAEMTKYISNALHALKITFSNEVGSLCKSKGIDGQKVMEIICQDNHLNISTAYFRPGFAFGGSCLPKDVRALSHLAGELDIKTPVLSAIQASNQAHLDRAIEMVESTGRNRIGILGLSFKPSTDDVRESPAVTLIETLLGRGYHLQVYDEVVDPEKLIGMNRAFLERALPHIALLLSDSLIDLIRSVEVVVITNGSPGFLNVHQLMHNDQILIDLVGISKDSIEKGPYEGICW